MQKTGVLLVNLGTPLSPSPKDVYRYLIEFLTDPRVIDVPFWKRECLVRGLIVPFRYKTSASCYQKIWTDEGSPLLVHGKALQKELQHALGTSYQVELAMRYQFPSLEEGLLALKRANVSKIIILPLFPQYASATTGSIHEKIMDLVKGWNVIPEMRFIGSYPTHPGFIATIVEIASSFPLNSYDHFVFSYHGLPLRQIRKADCTNTCLQDKNCCQKEKPCYAAECHATTRALKKALDLDESKTSHCYQSRLGKDPWLTPATSDTIKELALAGKKKILVFCPSFAADCLETIYEIAEEYKTEFLHTGGERLDLVPSLNTHPRWVQTLTTFCG